MAGFEHILRKAEPALRLPVGRRTRVLLEVGQDLEDLYAAYCARGLDAAAARARAAAVLGLSAETAASLTALHAPWWVVVLDRFGGVRARRAERVLSAAVTAVAVLLGVVALRAGEVWRADPVLAVGIAAALCVATLWMAASWLRLGRRAGAGVTGHGTLPIAGVAAIAGAAGALGAALELSELARLVESRGEWQAGLAVAKLADASMLLTFGVCVMLLILLLWLPLHRTARRLESEQAQLRSLPDGHTDDLTRGEDR